MASEVAASSLGVRFAFQWASELKPEKSHGSLPVSTSVTLIGLHESPSAAVQISPLIYCPHEFLRVALEPPFAFDAAWLLLRVVQVGHCHPACVPRCRRL